MAAKDDLARLKDKLRADGELLLMNVTDQAASALFARFGAFATSIRKATERRPLMSLLIAFHLAFAVACWGPRHAKR